MADTLPAMRGKHAGRPSTVLDTSVFEAVIAGGDVEARGELAAQLARLLCDPAAPAAEQRAVVPAVLKLAVDPVSEVRRELARRLDGCTELHPDILFTIVADEDAIALPFLAATPSLDRWRMLTILRVGDLGRQLVIAARPDLVADAVAEVAANGSLEVALVMLDNPAARLRPDDCRRLYLRFRDEPGIVERLLDRPDLPLDVRILQTRRAAGRIHTLVTERGWLAAGLAETIVADAEETTMLSLLEAAGDAELDRLVPFLGGKGMLNASIILRAACRGEMRIVERALAWLASLSVKRVRRLMLRPGAMGLKALHGAAGLPAASLPVLRAAVEAWRRTPAGGKSLSPEHFGRRLIESLMTGEDSTALSERVELLDLVARLTDERTSAVAKRLKDNLLKAA